MLARLCVLSSLLSLILATDKTRERVTGSDVVSAVVRLVEETCIFDNDFQMLRRLAWQETVDGKSIDFGWHNDTSKGGIWQAGDQTDIDKIIASLAPQMWTQIFKELGADIHTVLRDKGDLEMAINASIIARAKLYNLPEIPLNIFEQAKYWEKYYGATQNQEAALDFLNNIAQIPPCNLRGADILFMVDTSSSVDSGNLRLFLSNIIQNLPLGPNDYQIGIDSFTDTASTVVGFSSSKWALLKAVNDMKCCEGDKGVTEAALTNAFNSFKARTVRSASMGFPKVAVLVTDGIPSNPEAALKAADALKTQGITLIIAYITAQNQTGAHNLPIIVSYPKCMNYYSLKSYANLASDFPDHLTSRLCEATASVPQTSDYSVSTSLLEGRSASFNYNLDVTKINVTQGVTFALSATSGHSTIYVSTKTRIPSSAYNDYTATAEPNQATTEVYVSPETLASQTKNVTIYVTIAGVGKGSNSFTIKLYSGDTRPVITTVPPPPPSSALALRVMPALLFICFFVTVWN